MSASRGEAPPEVLDALAVAATGLLVLDERGRIVWANTRILQAMAATASADTVQGARLWDVLPRLRGRPEARAVRRTHRDGISRSFRLEYHDEQINGVFDVRVSRAPNDCVLLEIHDVSALLAPTPAERSAEVDAALLRALARGLAEARDLGAILNELSDLARRATGATASLISAVQGDRLVILHAEGYGMAERVTSVPLQGTVTERMTRERMPLVEVSSEGPSAVIREIMRDAEIGEIVAVPLVAHGQVVGSISVGRRVGTEAFGASAKRRLALLAEHAALPLWRAWLLEQAEAANRAKTNFLATMSHELRTPLTALTGYGELLADGVLGTLTPPQADAVERMRAVTHHLTVIIDEILTYSNLESGREEVRATRLDGRDIAREVAAIAEPLAKQKGIAFALELPDEEVELVSDGDRIRQILVNLASNAVKFTDRGSVAMRVRCQAGTVRFTVEDTGVGISNEGRAQLFQPFAQLDSGLTRRHGGTGLGLYISRRLAELLGGRITVQSEVGRGSVFELILPRDAAV